MRGGRSARLAIICNTRVSLSPADAEALAMVRRTPGACSYVTTLAGVDVAVVPKQ
jgi:hypothetical protein